MNYWILKSEPETFSFDDLILQTRSFWDGVRNYQARNYLKTMAPGDLAFFYHSSCKEVGVAGVMTIDSLPLADPTQFDPKSEYFDPKATVEHPRWFSVWMRPKEKFSKIVSLLELKTLEKMADHPLVKTGNRLSVLPLDQTQFDSIFKLGISESFIFI
ncbi:MAG: EVE domain-containing protein [Bacteriovoracaceae bacterium]|nr:EVE domain-containing protein [Bacteriovoracaceae bacterium]